MPLLNMLEILYCPKQTIILLIYKSAQMEMSFNTRQQISLINFRYFSIHSSLHYQLYFDSNTLSPECIFLDQINIQNELKLQNSMVCASLFELDIGNAIFLMFQLYNVHDFCYILHSAVVYRCYSTMTPPPEKLFKTSDLPKYRFLYLMDLF